MAEGEEQGERQKTGVEGSDVDPRFPASVAAGTVLLIFGSMLVAHFLLHNRVAPPEVPSPSLLAPAPQSPEHLRVAPVNRLLALRSAADARLNSYGWVNRSAGIVHIPIERAMELVIQRHDNSAKASP